MNLDSQSTPFIPGAELRISGPTSDKRAVRQARGRA
jgi:hypothetical protein